MDVKWFYSLCSILIISNFVIALVTLASHAKIYGAIIEVIKNMFLFNTLWILVFLLASSTTYISMIILGI